MIQSSRLLPGIVHELEFHDPNGELALMDAEASDILFYLGLKGSDTHLTINNQVGGVWYPEETLVLPPHDNPRRYMVWFKLTESRIEIWNDAAVHYFSRCSSSAASRIALSRLSGVANRSGSLSFRVMTPEAMALEIGYKVLARRVDRLEQKGILPNGEMAGDGLLNVKAGS